MSDPTMPSRRRTIRHLIIPLLALTVVGVLLGQYLFRYAWSVSQYRAYRQTIVEIDKLAEKKLPVSDADLAAAQEKLTSLDNEPSWIAILRQLHSEEFALSSRHVPILDKTVVVDALVDDFGFDGAWKYREPSTRLCVEQAKLLRQTHDLFSKKPIVRLAIKWNSFRSDFRSFDDLNQLSTLVETDAKVALASGDSVRLLQDLKSLFRMRETIDQLRILPICLLSTSLHARTLVLIQRAIEQGLLSSSELESIEQELVSRVEIGSAWSEVIIAERAFLLPTFLNPNILSAEIDSSKAYVFGHDGAFFLRTMQQAVDCPTHDWDLFWERMHVLSDETDKALSTVSPTHPTILSRMNLPSFDLLCAMFVRSAMLSRQALVAIRIRLAEQSHQSFPAKLDELDLQVQHSDPQPATPLVPFGAKPFGYRVGPTEAVLWSFDLREYRETPSEPPVTSERNSQSAMNRDVVWRLKKSSSQP